MILRAFAWRKRAPASLGRRQEWSQCAHSASASRDTPQDKAGIPGLDSGSSRPYTCLAKGKKHKREQDREFLISILESWATKRDAKAYLQNFGLKTRQRGVDNPVLSQGMRAVDERPRFAQGPAQDERPAGLHPPDDTLHVAIVKLKAPQLWHNVTLNGVVKTLSQLKALGLLSVVIVDCKVQDSPGGEALDLAAEIRRIVDEQIGRIMQAFSQHGDRGVRVVQSAFATGATATGLVGSSDTNSSSEKPTLQVAFGDSIMSPLNRGHIVVAQCPALTDQPLRNEVVDANDKVFALVRFFSGMQFPDSEMTASSEAAALDTTNPAMQHAQKAVVDRLIVIDPLGGIPSRKEGHGVDVFVNLEDEFDSIRERLLLLHSSSTAASANQLAHLTLARAVLRLLPATSSAVITSPAEAANLGSFGGGGMQDSLALLTGSVVTRRKQNPLIHNLLTDRPVYSSSLPLNRVKPVFVPQPAASTTPRMPLTTLIKKGLHISMFPDPRTTPWTPPKPGEARLRLTDTRIDLPRLIHLIDDSFNRKLDDTHYLGRVSESLAGIIIAGEYEGGAILTWERPFGLDEETAYREGRLVPYLDKFAVLKRSQGAGGVADVVFNAMVRDCFPEGVCWRSRQDNPVNKWYFERSRGTWKLDRSNWAMFWTTPLESGGDGVWGDEAARVLRDYENVCRNIVPSWLDGTIPAD